MLQIKPIVDEWVDPWPQCVDPNMYEVPDSIDTTPLPFTGEPGKWPTFDFGNDEAPPIGPLPQEEPGIIDWFNDALNPTPAPAPGPAPGDVMPNLDWLVDMF